MIGAFEAAILFVLNREGGYVLDPKDPGGETNFGISKRAHPDVDIKNLTREQAVGIYRKEYWDSLTLNRYPTPLAVAAFDCAVNQGVERAAQLLYKTHDLDDFIARRAHAYALLDSLDDRFGLGWMRRLVALHRLCISLEKP